MTFGWNFFEETGSIEAYLLYRELKRLLGDEVSQELLIEVDPNEREDAGTGTPRDESERSGQDPDGFDA